MIILQEKGKEFSQIAEEMEQIFQNWLHYSHMTEDEFLKRINQNNFEIQYNHDEEHFVWIDFCSSEKIGESIIKEFNNHLEFEESLMDFILLLNLIKIKVQEKKGNSRTIAKLYECSLKLNNMLGN